jgi:hypothetical protein
MSEILNVSRRSFLKTGALMGGGLMLGFSLPSKPFVQPPAIHLVLYTERIHPHWRGRRGDDHRQ